MTATVSLRLLDLGRPNLELVLLSILTLIMTLFAGLPSNGMYELMLAHDVVENYQQFVLIWMMNSAFWAFTFLPVLMFQVDKNKPDRPWLAWSNWAKAHSLILASCFYGCGLELVKQLYAYWVGLLA